MKTLTTTLIALAFSGAAFAEYEPNVNPAKFLENTQQVMADATLGSQPSVGSAAERMVIDRSKDDAGFKIIWENPNY